MNIHVVRKKNYKDKLLQVVKQAGGNGLIDAGSCNIHIIHSVLKAGNKFGDLSPYLVWFGLVCVD